MDRIAQVIRDRFQVQHRSGHVWWILRRKLGWSCQRPVGRARERNEAAMRDWKENVWPALKKAQNEGQIIVFVDESGLSERPHRVRTWSPRGVIPMLQHQFNWDHLSMAAGITLWQFYFRLYEGSMGKEEIVDFLRHLTKQISEPILLIWDRLPGHRSRVVQDYLAGLNGKISAVYLPRMSQA